MAPLPSPSSSSSTIADVIEIEETTTFQPFQWVKSRVRGPIDEEKFSEHNYAGQGTESNPFLVKFLPNDPQDAMTFAPWRKWMITILQAIATLAVTFVSSAYTGGIREIIRAFEVSQEVATLGVSLFVLGFAVGPLLWAPLSELYGRQKVFIVTYFALTAFNVGAACAQTMPTLLVLRFLAGAFGSSPLTNAGGVIADMFNHTERGLAGSPIVGGFLGEKEAAKGGMLDPEARLPLAMLGSIFLPIGLFWFAWTTYPSIHWAVPIVGSVFFGLGLVLVFLSLLNYLIDSYVVFAASVLAANSVLRSLFGAAFPLFTPHMYENLGVQWAGSVPAFLALACCQYASEAVQILQKIRAQHVAAMQEQAVLQDEEVGRTRSNHS
ncbi:hypothetical protein CEP52_007450 [Fusarium oligoseptatum]|uniref:Major facilitator superfamily (MFS) profile domain-containing protein n=1 Tax=Fusarium oligoseptatum TaxID=2604345 RepID=A0A428TMU4_9HYPO|nr:hypothetical protein CEP52_007450 [Fusarium oligoseptatum]